LGGIGMHLMSGPWDALQPPSSQDLETRWKDHITWCIDAFGPDHCMFESNFPVDSVTCSYNVLWNTFKRITADASPTDREHLFSNTARTVYRLAQP
jgi:predicted TIM-barrel fold metal-dependent hydrolase